MPDSVYSPPTVEVGSRPSWRRIRWLLISRLLRVGSAMVIWGYCARLLVPDLLAFLVGALLGLALWLPTSLILSRVVFFPGEPHPTVRDADGNEVVPDDHRWLNRATITEHLLGSLPLAAALIWALATLHGTPWLVALCLALPGAVLFARQIWRAAQRLWLSEATLDLATDDNHRALRHLLRLQSLGGRMSNGMLQMLAVAYHRTGDPQRALQTLDRITDPELYEVEQLAEQFAQDPR
ncbi:MAG: hypothetical protein KTR31_00395 [Myxococcales bacterium]|nr:hypothetical protein [Myxococcales bacterium]